MDRGSGESAATRIDVTKERAWEQADAAADAATPRPTRADTRAGRQIVGPGVGAFPTETTRQRPGLGAPDWADWPSLVCRLFVHVPPAPQPAPPS